MLGLGVGFSVVMATIVFVTDVRGQQLVLIFHAPIVVQGQVSLQVGKTVHGFDNQIKLLQLKWDFGTLLT